MVTGGTGQCTGGTGQCTGVLVNILRGGTGQYWGGREAPRAVAQELNAASPWCADLGAPLGLSAFDEEGQKQYNHVMQHLVLVPQRGVPPSLPHAQY